MDSIQRFMRLECWVLLSYPMKPSRLQARRLGFMRAASWLGGERRASEESLRDSYTREIGH